MAIDPLTDGLISTSLFVQIVFTSIVEKTRQLPRLKWDKNVPSPIVPSAFLYSFGI